MDRRTFLKTSPVAAAAAAATSSIATIMSGDHSEAHAKMAEAQAEMHGALGFGIDTARKTAISVTVRPFNYDSGEHIIDFTMPDGFVPTHVDSTYSGAECYELEILDNDGCAFAVSEAAFNAGALGLWRTTKGVVRARVQYTVPLSVLPCVTVTLYGDIV